MPDAVEAGPRVEVRRAEERAGDAEAHGQLDVLVQVRVRRVARRGRGEGQEAVEAMSVRWWVQSLVMVKALAWMAVGAVLMDSWRVAQEVQAGRELKRLRAEHGRGRREVVFAETGPAHVDEDGERWR